MTKRLLYCVVLLILVGGLTFTLYKINKPVENSENGAALTIKSVALVPKASKDPKSVTCIVNKQYTLKDGWQPGDLVMIDNDLPGKFYLRKEAAIAFEKMKKAANQDGIDIYVTSAYRSQAYQESLYNRYMSTDPQNAPYYSAKARSSEHELGLAIDISYDNQLHHDLQESSLGKWMVENGYRYGWIMRYPEDKIDITGYIFEAWHYRYVGVSLAKALKDSGLTLEEYYTLQS